MTTALFSGVRPAWQLALVLLLGLSVGSCSDAADVVAPVDEPIEEGEGEEDGTHLPLGVYEFRVSGIGGGDVSATGNLVALPALTDASSGLEFELTSVSNFIDGPRGQDGQRYVSLTYRVHNGSGSPLSNVALIPNTTDSTIAGTPWLKLTLFDGTPADTTIARMIVPTGAVALGEDIQLRSLYPDVLQVFSETEIEGLTLPTGVTGLFPYGFMVRHRDETATTRTIPATTDPDVYDGVLTFAFRFPLTAGNSTDPFSFTFWATAYADSEVRITESLEEAGDTAAMRRLRDRAAALGATTTTVLAGSTAPSPDVPAYPGQRQICTVRTAGTAAAPTSHINMPAAFSHFMLLRPGETVDACAPAYRSGTPERPATNVPFPLDVTAVDRYGNVKTSVTEMVHLENMSGPAVNLPGDTALVDGRITIPVTYTAYGTSTLAAIGDRNRGWQTIPVQGVTRVWTAGAGTTDWSTGGNWQRGAAPMGQDSVLIPLAAPEDPALTANVALRGVTVEDGATLSLGAFNLTAASNVLAGTSGGIINTTGILYLTGSASQLRGILPRVSVTGTYSLVGNATVRAPLRSDMGRITAGRYRMQVTSY